MDDGTGIQDKMVVRLVTLCNQLAFTHVAIYGLSFTEASRATWNMIQHVGLYPLINSWLLQMVCFVGAVSAGGFAAVLGVLLTWLTNLSEAVALWAVAVLCFVLGFGLASSLTELVNTVVNAVFVCYARDTSFLMRKRPDVFEVVTDAFETFAGQGNDDDYESENERRSIKTDDDYESENELGQLS